MEKKSADNIQRPIRNVNGRRVADDLALLFQITRNPAFEAGRRFLIAHNLHKRGGVRAYMNNLASNDILMGEMNERREDARREKRWFSLRAEAEKMVAQFGIHGASFEAAVDALRKKFAIYDKTGQFISHQSKSGNEGKEKLVRAYGRSNR